MEWSISNLSCPFVRSYTIDHSSIFMWTAVLKSKNKKQILHYNVRIIFKTIYIKLRTKTIKTYITYSNHLRTHDKNNQSCMPSQPSAPLDWHHESSWHCWCWFFSVPGCSKAGLSKPWSKDENNHKFLHQWEFCPATLFCFTKFQVTWSRILTGFSAKSVRQWMNLPNYQQFLTFSLERIQIRILMSLVSRLYQHLINISTLWPLFRLFKGVSGFQHLFQKYVTSFRQASEIAQWDPSFQFRPPRFGAEEPLLNFRPASCERGTWFWDKKLPWLFSPGLGSTQTLRLSTKPTIVHLF